MSELGDEIPYPLKKECLSCGGEVQRFSSEWSNKCKACEFEWRECHAKDGQDLMYRRRNKYMDWRDGWVYVPCGTIGVFGEVEL